MQHKGDVIMATARFGRGTVFALGDSWPYNEYVDGRKLPAEFENYNRARSFAVVAATVCAETEMTVVT